MSTKIHLAADHKGRARKLILGPGHQSDYAAASALINGLQSEILIADKGYDADWLIKQATEQCATKQIVIPARSRKSKEPRRTYNEQLYKDRNKVERYFCKLKEWRRVLTRFEKTAMNFMAFVHFAAAIINHSL